MNLEDLIPVLEASLRKNGDKPLTISHLLNILRMMSRQAQAPESVWLKGVGMSIADNLDDPDYGVFSQGT